MKQKGNKKMKLQNIKKRIMKTIQEPVELEVEVEVEPEVKVAKIQKNRKETCC